MNVEMVEATAKGAGDIARIRSLAWQQGYRGILPDSVLDALDEDIPHRTAQFAEEIAKGRAWVYSIRVDGAEAGFCAAGPCPDSDTGEGDGELTAIYLLEPYWGRGISGQVMDFCEELLRQKGFGRVLIWVFRENHRARRFYQKHGYTADGQTQDVDFGGPRPALRYRKAL